MLPDQQLRQDLAAVIPTVGRPEALAACLRSFSAQTMLPSKVIVVHCGDDTETRLVCERAVGLTVSYMRSPFRGAALQRDLGIRSTDCPLILLGEDDVEVERDWVAALVAVVTADAANGGAMGRMLNQPFTSAAGIWRIYRRLVAAPSRANQPGTVIGALVPNGFPPDANAPVPTEWIGGGVALLRREAYFEAGRFAAHYRGSSPGEDIDLGYRMSRNWRLWYVPAARSVHRQVLTGREPGCEYWYLSMRSRYAFCRVSARMSAVAAFVHILLWAVFQTASELGQLRRGRLRPDFLAACGGRVRGAWSCVGWDPAAERFPEWHDTQANA